MEATLQRREFFKRSAALAGGVTAAMAGLPLVTPSRARAGIVAENDPRLATGYIDFPGATGQVRAYSARPATEEKRPGVVVIHENRGLNPHIEDVSRRFALEGFWALAPDALSPVGGTPADPDKARDLINDLDRQSTIDNFAAATAYLMTDPQCTGKVGVVGFCWGGAMANALAVNVPDLTAAVPYYGRQPAAEDVPKIGAALLLHYAGDDERINAGIPEFEAALKKAGVTYTIFTYPGAKHAFNNDTNADRYNRQAAELAWERTLIVSQRALEGIAKDPSGMGAGSVVPGSTSCTCARSRTGRGRCAPGPAGPHRLAHAHTAARRSTNGRQCRKKRL